MSFSPMCPPQTYSRLFRPWDVAQTTTTTTTANLKLSREIKSEKYDNGISDSVIKSIEASNSRSSEIAITTTFHTFGSTLSDNKIYQQHLSHNYLDTYISHHEATQFEPYMLSLMEQEYLRVLNEEAQSKAMSAKRQRPKKFKCPHCDVAFTNNGQLKGHIRIHTGERPFQCCHPQCGKTFTRNEELTRHKRIHTGQKPYSCLNCGKRFGRKDHLKKHTKTHMVQDKFNIGQTVLLPIYHPYLYGY